MPASVVSRQFILSDPLKGRWQRLGGALTAGNLMQMRMWVWREMDEVWKVLSVEKGASDRFRSVGAVRELSQEEEKEVKRDEVVVEVESFGKKR